VTAKIKFCGIMRAEDGGLAAAAGAGYLGVVFAEGPRAVTADRARVTADTVGQALDLVRPDIVDLSSGVERLPGIKDSHKIACFVEAVFAHSPVT